jgi:hypothetical protein
LNGLFFLLPFDIAFNSIIVLHFFLGGLFTYLFLKDLKVNSTGALISGLIFMLSGYLLSVHSLLTILLSSVWTPLIMMFFRRAILSPGFKNEMLTSIFMTISFLGGGVEIVYGNFLVLLFMAIFHVEMGGRGEPPLQKGEDVGDPLCVDSANVGDKPRRYKFLGSVPIYWGRIGFFLNRFKSLLLVSAIFVLLSAIQLIPFVELFIHSIRGKGLTYQEATIWSFAPKDVLLFFLPDVYGYFVDMKKYWVNQCWFKTLYAGGLPFILSLIFFLFGDPVGEPLRGLPDRATAESRPYRFSSDGRSRKFFLALIVLSLFLSLGQYNPLYLFVFQYVPFFSGIRYPVKFLYIFILVLSMTAGLGFQRMTESSGNGGNRRLKNLFISFSLASGLFLLLFVLGHKEIESFLKGKGIDAPDFSFLSVNLYHAKRFFFYLALFFLTLRVGYEVKWRGWIKVLLVLFLAADLFGNMGFYGKEKTQDYFRKTRILEIITSDQDHFRIFSTAKTISTDVPILVGNGTYIDYSKEKHLPSMNLLYKLHDIWGIDVIHLKRIDDLYRAFTGTPSISSSNLVDLYSMKYIISVTPIEGDPRFELIYSRLEGLQGKREDLLKENTVKLYRNRNPLPRAWLVRDHRVLDEKSILASLSGKEFNPRKEVLLEEEPGEGDRSGSPLQKKPLSINPQSAIRNPKSFGGLPEFISESNNRLQLLVEAKEDSFLVLSDTYYPGWKAYVDGKEERIYRANYAFRAIPIRAGAHKVEFTYKPLSFKLGAVITLLGILGCVGIAFVKKRRGVPLRTPSVHRWT